jgi:dTDP-4-amino-4,6-dideoxygalactose transaminase
VVSLHATKILGAGEGGFIVTTDSSLRDKLRGCCNFGFQGTRSAVLPALNAKMSEYHAAVALANLTSWPVVRSRHIRIAEWYRHHAYGLDGVSLQPGYGNGWAASTTSVVFPPNSAPRVAGSLLKLGIETRAWWGEGCHPQPAFSDCARGALPVTEDLGGRVLGLPHFPDIEERDIKQVMRAASEVCRTLGAAELIGMAEAVSFPEFGGFPALGVRSEECIAGSPPNS